MRRLSGVVRWAAVAVYALIAWTLDHDGVTEAEFVSLLILGVIASIYLLCADWILRGVRIEVIKDEKRR